MKLDSLPFSWGSVGVEGVVVIIVVVVVVVEVDDCGRKHNLPHPL